MGRGGRRKKKRAVNKERERKKLLINPPSLPLLFRDVRLLPPGEEKSPSLDKVSVFPGGRKLPLKLERLLRDPKRERKLLPSLPPFPVDQDGLSSPDLPSGPSPGGQDAGQDVSGDDGQEAGNVSGVFFSFS